MGGLLLVILDIPQEKAHEVVSHERSYRRRLEHGDLGSLITTEVRTTREDDSAFGCNAEVPLLALASKNDMLAAHGSATSMTRA